MPAPDSFANQIPELDSPITRWFAIAPSDTSYLPAKPRVVFVKVAGDLRIVNDFGDDVTLTLDVGWHPIRPDKVMATGTTATAFGLY